MTNEGAADKKGTKRSGFPRPAGSSTPKPSGSTAVPVPSGASNPMPAAPHGGVIPPVNGNLNSAQTRETRRASTMLMNEKQLRTLDGNISTLNTFINHQYMQSLDHCEVEEPASLPEDRKSIAMYELTKLMISDKEDTYEKLVSLYAALYNIGASVGVMLRGTEDTSHFYLCVMCNDNGVSAQLLRNSVRGHFPGSKLKELSDVEVDIIMNQVEAMPPAPVNGASTKKKYIRTVSIVPSRRTQEQENRQLLLSAQGIEKYIDSMRGRVYTVLFLADPLRSETIDQCKRGFELLYTLLSPFSKETVSYSENESDATNFSLSMNLSESISEGISESYGTSHTTGTSTSAGHSHGHSTSFFGIGFNSGSNWSSGTNVSDGETKGTGKMEGRNKGKGSGESQGDSHTTGSSRSINLTRDVKMVQDSLGRLEAEIQRIEANRGFGMWNCCGYVIAEDLDVAAVAAGSLQSLLCGDAAYGGNSYTNLWSCISQKQNASRILSYLSYMQHPKMIYQPDPASSLKKQTISPSMMVSGRDLPTLLSLPRRSVQGMQVLSMAEFGRNFPREFKPKRPIKFGSVIHMGEPDGTEMLFDLDIFAAHCFICGAAGSGKSNTTYNLLESFHKNKIPFMVIEPAKGEYKREFGGMPGIQVFTSKPDSFRMLSINPFEFHRDVHIKEHLDHLNSVVSTCWPLYGPMPAMLKQAFEEAYIACGWDLELSERVMKTGREFPTFSDVLPAIERIINDSSYSGESKGDFKGALCMRIRGLMTGFEGLIFGNTHGISDKELFENNTIIDLSNIGNPETRALIMGLLVIKLREFRFATQKGTNNPLLHVTVLEEAHNILKRCSQEQSQDSGNVQGAAVSALVDCIAEMRSSGEGFLIIDQSPGAVDEAALKNTAIKIVMRLPERKDCEAIGNTMGLTEEQLRELTRLDRGEAVVYHEGWEEPVLGKMGEIWARTAQAAIYRKMPQPVSRNDLLRIKGALTQWLCSLYCNNDMDDFKDMRKLDRLVSILKAKDHVPNVNENIWKDIRQQFVELMAELKAEFGTMDEIDKIKVRYLLGRFLRHFLQIDGIFRVCPLSLPEYEAKNVTKPTDRQCKAIGEWWKKIQDLISSYILMPIKCGANPLQWTNVPMNGQYMKTALQLILLAYGKDYTKEHSGLSIYECAYHFLRDSTLKGE